MRAVATALLSVAALALVGCGTDGLTSEASDAGQGKVLFQQKCGGCHTLREAGTEGSSPDNPASGPNLDAAFAAPRMEGFDESVIRETVRQQIDYPTPPMPEDLVEGDEADAVAVYVALVAAQPEAKVASQGGSDTNDPKALFTSNCAGCHSFAAAGTNGKVGPNLDQISPTEARIAEQIRNGGGGMPPFQGQLTDAQIDALIVSIQDFRKRTEAGK